MRMCRVGLVGAGGVADRHARVLSGFEDVRLVGVTDVAHEPAARLAERYGGQVFPDVGALVAAGLDAVYVCVPPFAHGPVEQVVLDAGCPLFVEKPVAVDLPTAERIAERVAERGVLTAVGHHWRYLGAVREAQRLLAGRSVRLVSGTWWDRVPSVDWWARRGGSGGPVVEQATHVLDLVRLLVGEVREVTAYGDGRPPPVAEADIESVTVAAMRFTNGTVGTFTSACVLDRRQRAGLEILADGLTLNLTEEGLTAHDRHGDRHFPADPGGARVAVDRAFVDAVRGLGDDVRTPYQEALATHRLACAVAESAHNGRTVFLEPARSADTSARPLGEPSRTAEPVVRHG